MKRTQRRDAQRNIRKQWVSFLSIVIIAAMAVSAYLGLNYSARAIAKNANRFYDGVGFRDAEIVSTLLLSEEDLDTLRATEGVADVEPMWQSAGTLNRGEACKDVAVVSLTERVNAPQLLSGRLPETEDECVVDRDIAEALGLTVGDPVQLSGAQYLLREQFTVCGISLNADHACTAISTPGERNMVVLPSAFDLESLDNCAMKAVLRFSDCAGVDRFDAAYFTAAADTLERVKALAGPLSDRRTEAIHAQYGSQIDEGEAQLADAEAQLSDARQQLDEGWAELDDGEAQAADAEKQLADAEKQLADARAELDDGEAALAQGGQQLADGRAQLEEAKAQLADALRQLTDGQAELDAALAELTDGRRQLDEGWAEYHENEALLADARQQLDDGQVQLDDAQAQLDEAKAQLEEAKAQLDEGQAQFEDAGKRLRDAEKQLEDGSRQLVDAREQLTEGWAQLEAGKEQVRSALRALLPDLSSIDIPDGDDKPGGSDYSVDPDANVYTVGPDTQAPSAGPGGAPLLSGGASRSNPVLSQLAGEASLPQIVWSQPQETVDLESRTVTAMELSITEYPKVVFDLNFSLEDHAVVLLGQLKETYGVSDEALRAVMESQFGPMGDLTGDALLRESVRRLTESSAEYAEYSAQYRQLADGARTWDDGHAQYIEGSDRLMSGSRAFLEGQAQYVAARKELEEGWALYNDGLAQYEAGLAEFNEKKAEFEDGLAQYNDGVAQLAEGLKQLEAGEAEYADGLAQYEAGAAELADGWTQYQEGLAQYEDAAALLEEKTGEYYDGLAQYAEGLAQYEEGLAQYTEGTQEYADAMQALSDGRAELDDGEAQYASGMAEYLEGVLKLSDARAQLDGMDQCRWVILDPNGNASYQVVKADVQNVSDLAMAFALIFILVGALVIYATLGKIVEEQRRLVGATRALGFYKKEILAKYLFFGVGATLLGMLLGVAIGYFLIQPMLTNGYAQFFNFDDSGRALSPVATLAVLLGGLVLSTLAVVLACTDLLRSTATSLMQDKAPAVKHRGSRSAKGGSLYARLILLNMRTDLKRVVVTIVSVAGCCALLVTGFTMQNGVMGSLDRRFGDILRFDCTAYLTEDSGEAAFAAARGELERAGAQAVAVRTGSQLYSIDGLLNVNTLYCGDLEEMQSFVHFAQAETGQRLSAEPEGVWICDKVSEVSGLRAGDSITLYDDMMRPYTTPIAGVFEDYLIRDMVMSRESYAHIFGDAPEDNALLVKAGDMGADALEQLLSSLPDVARVNSNARDRAVLYDISSILNLVSLLMVGLAAIMAFFIILNLINIQINQKKRELTIMRVNGFTVREVISYILQETAVTNVVGILLGLGLGAALAYRIILLMEGVTARFVRTPQPIALVLAALITVGFSVILNVIALRKVKHLKLTDIA